MSWNHSLTRRVFLGMLPGALEATSLAKLSTAREEQERRPNQRLWYRAPAATWNDALPIGNGRLGAMVFGGAAHEVLSLNEDTLWSGKPRDWNNPGARAVLPKVRKAVLEDADYHAADRLCMKMQGPYTESYQPMASLELRFDDHLQTTQYERELDLETGVASVSYVTEAAAYRREMFVSAPDDVLVMHITCSRPGGLQATIALSSLLRAQVQDGGSDELVLVGKAPAHVEPNYKHSTQPVIDSDVLGDGMYFATVLGVRQSGGSVHRDQGKLFVRGATTITLILNGATGFRGYQAAPDLSQQATTEKARLAVRAAQRKTYESLRMAHRRSHRKLQGRVSLTLGPDVHDDLPTDERLVAYAAAPDPQLLALYFQYGRYLLIASSRPGTQPANLQGIWNQEVRPPWSSNWTANINLQMNYWLAETCHLGECHTPLFDMMRDLAVNGAVTAATNYGLPGWVSHHNIDLWRQSAPVGEGNSDPTWANFAMSGPWLCAHLWEHFLFSGDAIFLRERAYPLMKGSAEFCLAWLVEDAAHRLTTCPSVSTENNFRAPDGKIAEVSAGCTLDMALIGELFAHCISAAGLLNLDAAFAGKLAAARAKLVPFQVGRFGQLQEWSEDFVEATPGQRHMSHLYPLYPGSAITPAETPALAQAARVSLERRLAAGGAYTGWSRSWAICLWARLLDGNKAEESLGMLLKHSTGTNLFDTHPADHGAIFQIDGNFGATAGVAEMLLQSHGGEIALLPALPATWKAGQVAGLCARGGHVLDMQWSEGRLTSATLKAGHRTSVTLAAPTAITAIHKRGGAVEAQGLGTHRVQMTLQPGLVYTLAFA